MSILSKLFGKVSIEDAEKTVCTVLMYLIEKREAQSQNANGQEKQVFRHDAVMAKMLLTKIQHNQICITSKKILNYDMDENIMKQLHQYNKTIVMALLEYINDNKEQNDRNGKTVKKVLQRFDAYQLSAFGLFS